VHDGFFATRQLLSQFSGKKKHETDGKSDRGNERREILRRPRLGKTLIVFLGRGVPRSVHGGSAAILTRGLQG